MYQEPTRRLSDLSQRCHVRKFACLLARPLSPERLQKGLETMLEYETHGLHGDPEREAKVWLEQLADAECKRSSFQDMAAEGLITFDELRTKLATLQETCETA